jgi:glucose/arabinose dehydrogenase
MPTHQTFANKLSEIPPPPPKPSRLVIVLGLVPLVLAGFLITISFSRPVRALEAPRKFNSTDIKLADGYKIEPVIENLTAPSAAIFDGNNLIIAESGSTRAAAGRILKIKSDGTVDVIIATGLHGAITGLAIKDGLLYVSSPGKISRIDSNGRLHEVVTGLPSEGDYQNTNIVFGPDGRLYMGQGTVTNAGIVGVDNFALGWLDLHPNLHEVPCQDVKLLGQNYQTADPTRPGSNVPMVTGAYEPFGAPSIPDEFVNGNLKCGGAILRFNSDGSDIHLVAWGLRNPVGVKFDKSGQLWATNQGPEERGSRHIGNAPDYFVRVAEGAWYGWPDFFDGVPVTADRFIVPGEPQAGFLWDSHPTLSSAFLSFAPNEAASGFAFSPGGAFGFAGDAFVAMFGPAGSTLDNRVGFRIARVDVKARKVYDFASNAIPGAAYANQRAGLDRPTDILFGPDGGLYIVDMGETQMTALGRVTVPQTGAVWRIYPSNGQPLRAGGPLIVQASTPKVAGERSLDTGDMIGNYVMMAIMAAPSFVLLLGGLIVAGFVMLVAWQILRGLAH